MIPHLSIPLGIPHHSTYQYQLVISWCGCTHHWHHLWLYLTSAWPTVLPASHNIYLTCRSTSQPSVTMSSRPATVLGDPSAPLPMMKVRSHHHPVCDSLLQHISLHSSLPLWTEELTAPRELTDAPMATNPSPVVVSWQLFESNLVHQGTHTHTHSDHRQYPRLRCNATLHLPLYQVPPPTHQWTRQNVLWYLPESSRCRSQEQVLGGWGAGEAMVLDHLGGRDGARLTVHTWE